MKQSNKKLPRLLAKHLGLKIVFVSYLPAGIYGKLLPREKRILINALKPRFEHVFTILHEIGHYAVHFKKLLRDRHCPWFLRLNWKSDALQCLASKVRRYARSSFNNEKGREWEADVWAMCAFLQITKRAGGSDLRDFLDHHPEKSRIFWLAAVSLTLQPD